MNSFFLKAPNIFALSSLKGFFLHLTHLVLETECLLYTVCDCKLVGDISHLQWDYCDSGFQVFKSFLGVVSQQHCIDGKH